MQQISRQQIIAWSVVVLIVLLVGANYLRSQIGKRAPENTSVVTVGLTQEHLSAPIKVHVTGAVAGPGLYELKSGDRVADALARAGGATAEADISQINLAAKLTDGQQLVVALKGQAPQQGAAGATAATGGASGAAGAANTPAQPIDLNNATAAQLEGLDGVGPKTAQKIIEYREANGGFKSVEELMEVPGIGPAKFEQIKGQVFV